jgi:hypothetical protein
LSKNRLLLNVVVALILGTVLTLSSWIVVKQIPCMGVPSCASAVTIGRGFPLPWISEYILPSIPPFQGGVERQADFGGLAFDLGVWSWLAIVGLLTVAKQRRERVRSLIPARMWLVGVLLGLASIIAGLFLALVVPPITTMAGPLLPPPLHPQPQVEYVPPALFDLSLLGYCVMILGVGTAVAGYRRSTAAPWLTCLAAGVLVTLATLLVPQWIVASGIFPPVSNVWPPVSGIRTYGFPLDWFIIETPTVLPPLFFVVVEWAFLMDVLIWSSISAAILFFVSATRFGTSHGRQRLE